MRQPFSPDLRLLYPRATLTGSSSGDSLENVLVDEMPDGALCMVPGVGLYQLEKSSTDAVSPPTVIATARGASAPGRWTQFVGGSGATPPLRNTLYVDPTSTVAPETGTILAPYTSMQDASDAITLGEQWTIIIPSGIEIAESFTIRPGSYLEIAAEGLDQGGILTGNITWNAADAFVGLTNVFLTGNITGAATGSPSTFILQNSIVEGNITFTGSQVHVYMNGVFPMNPAEQSAYEFGTVNGTVSTIGDVLAKNMAFRDNLTFRHGAFENCQLGSSLTTVAITASGTSLRFIDTQLLDVPSVTFSGAAGTISMDGQSLYYYGLNSFRPTNGTLLLLESELKFGGILANANANIDPDDGSLFYVDDITANRDYTLVPTGRVNETIWVECRNSTVNTPALRNGGGTPGLLVNMEEGFGYIGVSDGTDFFFTSVYSLNQ